MGEPEKVEPNGNGTYLKLAHIEQDVKEIKDDLSHSIDKLTHSIDNLCSKFESFMIIAQNSIPIKAVFWLIGIMVLGLVGIEGIKQIGPILSSIFHAPI